MEIIMYHYIRNFKVDKYKLKGLDVSEFEKQIIFLKKNYNIISANDLKLFIDKKCDIPKNSVLLTFDDGYREHFEFVYPVLLKYNIKAFFSMPSMIIAEEKVLDVNKIHFILAATKKERIISDIWEELNYFRSNSCRIEDNEILYKRLAIANRFDDKDTIFIKRLLQKELDIKFRRKIVDKLFKRYVCDSEKNFCKQIYMNYSQIKTMKKNGMEFGIHGHTHDWLDIMSKKEIKYEIDNSLCIFGDVIDINNWIMCYPYGAYNDNVINYIRENGCKIGITTEVAAIHEAKTNRYKLPRLDTNDYPPVSENFKKYCLTI